MALATALLLYLGRGTTYSIDELPWLIESPDLGLGEALRPHNGHLILTTRLLYKGILEVFGSDYLAFRLLATASVLLTSGLVFVYAKRRVGPWVALAPSLVLLVFGSDIVHVLVGNAITVLVAISCGLGALIALDRDDRRGEIVACLLLCLGVVTYSVAVAFAAGIAVALLAERDRRRRIWIAALPLAIYAGWWLWSLGQPSGSEGQLVYSNVLLIPVWAFQSVAAALGALSGLDFRFAGSAEGDRPAGTVLAMAGIAALFWWRLRGAVSPRLLGVIAIALALFAIEAVAHTPLFSSPFSPRYLFPGAVVVILVAVEAARGVRWSNRALVVVCVLAAVGIASNIAALRNGARGIRDGYTPNLRAELTGLELAGDRLSPDFDPHTPLDGQNSLVIPFAEAAVLRASPAQSYLEAVDRYGGAGFEAEQLAQRDDAVRARTDAVLAAALGVRLQPVPIAPPDGCRRLSSTSGMSVVFPLTSDATVIESERPAAVSLGRFASTPTVDLGALAAGRPAALIAPSGSAPGRWQASVDSASLRVCGIR
jgi:hypothetical protein